MLPVNERMARLRFGFPPAGPEQPADDEPPGAGETSIRAAAVEEAETRVEAPSPASEDVVAAVAQAEAPLLGEPAAPMPPPVVPPPLPLVPAANDAATLPPPLKPVVAELAAEFAASASAEEAIEAQLLPESVVVAADAAAPASAAEHGAAPAYGVAPREGLSGRFGARLGDAARSVASPVISGLVHAALLLIFANIYVPEQKIEVARQLVLVAEKPVEEETPPEPELTLAPPGDEPHENLLASLAMSVAPIENLDAQLLEVPQPVVPESEVFAPSPPEPLEMLEGAIRDDTVLSMGSVGEEVAHVEGAVDRITHEIVTRLQDDDLIVIWLMDASLSLVEERAEVAARLERIYAETEQVGRTDRDALLSAVVAFGETTAEMVGPTSDGAQVVEGIRNVPDDESGIENVFAAVRDSVDRYRPFRTREQRTMMVIVWTDESGDDYAHLEEAVDVCRKLSVPVFTVGPSAMFGVELGAHAYKHPDNGQVYMLPVNRGPESIRQERLEVPYWFQGPQLDSLHSGLSPFALTRLANETGGAYLIKDNESDRSDVSLETMQAYVPEYESPQEYLERVGRSPLRAAVLQAVDITRQRKLKGTPQLAFAPTGDNFQQQLREAQETVAYNLATLEQALAAFGPKGMETAWKNETSPRWRAWYDLTYGRLLAMRVRCNEYNLACAVMKGLGSDFVDKQSNRWEFRPAEKLTSGSQGERYSAEAHRLLARCSTENAGTPWAALAQRELEHAFGFTVDESYVAPPPPPRPQRPAAVNPPPPPPRQPPQGRRAEQPQMLEKPVEVKLPKL